MHSNHGDGIKKGEFLKHPSKYYQIKYIRKILQKEFNLLFKYFRSYTLHYSTFLLFILCGATF